MYQVHVKCDHASPADVNNDINLWHNNRQGMGPVVIVSICDSCKAAMGDTYAPDAQLDED